MAAAGGRIAAQGWLGVAGRLARRVAPAHDHWLLTSLPPPAAAAAVQVLESELEKHKARCPGYQFWLAERAQPFFCEGVNGGPPEEEVAWPEGLAPLPPPPEARAAADAEADVAAGGAAGGAPRKKRARRARPAQGSGGLAAAYAAGLGPQRFEELLGRIEAACERVRLRSWQGRMHVSVGGLSDCAAAHIPTACSPQSLVPLGLAWHP